MSGVFRGLGLLVLVLVHVVLKTVGTKEEKEKRGKARQGKAVTLVDSVW